MLVNSLSFDPFRCSLIDCWAGSFSVYRDVNVKNISTGMCFLGHHELDSSSHLYYTVAISTSEHLDASRSWPAKSIDRLIDCLKLHSASLTFSEHRTRQSRASLSFAKYPLNKVTDIITIWSTKISQQPVSLLNWFIWKRDRLRPFNMHVYGLLFNVILVLVRGLNKISILINPHKTPNEKNKKL